MKLQYSELDNGIRLIELIGALDMNGTYSIEIEFVRQCAGENVQVVVDLSQSKLSLIDWDPHVDQYSQIGCQPGWENGFAQPSTECCRSIWK